MPATDEAWAKAYAKQALSDLDAREELLHQALCHRLHYLQMAAEKVCKAYLTGANGHEQVRKTHAYVARNLPVIARQIYGVAHAGDRIAQWELQQVRALAEEIERLAPACDECGTRPDNTEYPWLDPARDVRTPCEYGFPGIDDGHRGMVRLIRLIRTASELYADDSSRNES